MEPLIDNGQGRGNTRLEKAWRLTEGLRTGGMSLVVGNEYPTDEEITALEAQGYNPEQIQGFIDSLQASGPQGARRAAMLRGAFNDLITQINSKGE